MRKTSDITKVLTMKKATTKKSTAKKAKKAVKKATPASAAKGKVSGGKFAKQPQVKQQALFRPERSAFSGTRSVRLIACVERGDNGPSLPS
jgi:hypothetical protein